MLRFLNVFSIVGINQKISTNISNITEKNGLFEKIQRIIDKTQNASDI